MTNKQTERPVGLTVESSDEDYYNTMRTMELFGGHFASALAGVMAYADSTNQRRIIHGFPELMVKYGPGSNYFNEYVFGLATQRARDNVIQAGGPEGARVNLVAPEGC